MPKGFSGRSSYTKKREIEIKAASADSNKLPFFFFFLFWVRSAIVIKARNKGETESENGQFA